MPSASPDIWRRDVEWTRKCLPSGKLLNVSVVGTIQPGWSLIDLADDYARCAKWAIESGADCVETNLSCPNVSTCDGQLYQNPSDAALVAHYVREVIGEVPYIVKIGHVPNRADAKHLLDALEPYVDGLVMTNSISTTVMVAGSPAFDGQRRGICGAATREASLEQIAVFSALIRQSNSKLQLIACGGAATAEHVQHYLKGGASAVHIATAAMIAPSTALQIRRDFAAGFSPVGELRSAT
jgi:dihydroorotate dehydrogenase